VSEGEVQVAHYGAAPKDARTARQLVSHILVGWGLHDLVEVATLCTGELAANAVFHGRTPFDLVVRRRGEGVRIDAIDQRPQEVPVAVPLTGTAADITRHAATGRGLQIVAALATRWGYTTSTVDKSVWVEIEPGRRGAEPEPVVELGHVAVRSPGDAHLDLRSMPVRAAVASGVQVDELVREVQLGGRDGADLKVLARLYRLLDDSAPARLGGRHAALRAAGRDEQRFDLVLDAPFDTLTAVAELSALLEELAVHRSGRARVPADVLAYRAWLQDESRRQLRGSPPQPCPLP
jgi:anti-sigma regulatory factor (Ser/Thr protein kinase)